MRNLISLNDDELVDLLIWAQANEKTASPIAGDSPSSWILPEQDVACLPEISTMAALISWCQNKLSPATTATSTDRQELVVVIGGSRGIGLGFVEDYLIKGYSVFTTYRDNGRWDALKALKKRFPHVLTLSELEVIDETAVEGLPEKIKGPITILVLSAGVLLCAPGSYPLTDSVEEMRRTMEINTFAPDHIMRVLFPQLLHPNSCALYISSTLGHFAENLKGRYHTYRASKAAGNILMQNWNTELARVWLEQGGDLMDRPCAFPMSPGVVQTDMAAGFPAPLSVAQSVAGMTAVVDAVRKHKQASFYLYDGSTLQSYPEPLIVTTKRQEQDALI